LKRPDIHLLEGSTLLFQLCYMCYQQGIHAAEPRAQLAECDTDNAMIAVQYRLLPTTCLKIMVWLY
jgi:hypothetical protein